MIQNSNLLQFLKTPDLFDQLKEPGAFVTVDHLPEIAEWKIIHLNPFQRVIRTVFGNLGPYRNTISSNVALHLKKEYAHLITFDEGCNHVQKIMRAIQKLQLLDSSEVKIEAVSKDVVDSIAPENPALLQKTQAFVTKNKELLVEIGRLGLSFKIRPNGFDRLAIRSTTEGVAILGKKILGKGGFKKIKTAYNVDTGKLFARAITTIKSSRMNIFDRWLYERMASNELHFLQKLQGESTAIQLRSHYTYITNLGYEKRVMLLDLADGDLYSLLKMNISEEQRLDIADQLVDSLAALSQKNIWHRDIKPLNFLYFKEGERYRVVVADFGLSAVDRDVIAEKCIAGTYQYMPPENFWFFRLTNGKKGDVYSMGLVLSEFFFDGRLLDGAPEFIADLIKEMTNKDPGLRPTAEEVQNRFKEGYEKYKEEMI